MREGIGLLQKCMQCFILIEQTICERMKISITELLNIPSVLPPCLAKAEVVLGGTISKLSMGIFVWCNKLVRRGKAGCSSQETSNSGMATHMRSRHRDQAIQVVQFKMNKVSIDITLLSRCREHSTLPERGKLNPSGHSSSVQIEIKG